MAFYLSDSDLATASKIGFGEPEGPDVLERVGGWLNEATTFEGFSELLDKELEESQVAGGFDAERAYFRDNLRATAEAMGWNGPIPEYEASLRYWNSNERPLANETYSQGDFLNIDLYELSERWNSAVEEFRQNNPGAGTKVFRTDEIVPSYLNSARQARNEAEAVRRDSPLGARLASGVLSGAYEFGADLGTTGGFWAAVPTIGSAILVGPELLAARGALSIATGLATISAAEGGSAAFYEASKAAQLRPRLEMIGLPSDQVDQIISGRITGAAIGGAVLGPLFAGGSALVSRVAGRMAAQGERRVIEGALADLESPDPVAVRRATETLRSELPLNPRERADLANLAKAKELEAALPQQLRNAEGFDYLVSSIQRMVSDFEGSKISRETADALGMRPNMATAVQAYSKVDLGRTGRTEVRDFLDMQSVLKATADEEVAVKSPAIRESGSQYRADPLDIEDGTLLDVAAIREGRAPAINRKALAAKVREAAKRPGSVFSQADNQAPLASKEARAAITASADQGQLLAALSNLDVRTASRALTELGYRGVADFQPSATGHLDMTRIRTGALTEDGVRFTDLPANSKTEFEAVNTPVNSAKETESLARAANGEFDAELALEAARTIDELEARNIDPDIIASMRNDLLDSDSEIAELESVLVCMGG